MSYVLWNFFFCTLAGFLLGGLLGWLLRGLGFGSRLAQLESDWSAKAGLAESERDAVVVKLRESEGLVAGLRQKVVDLDSLSARLKTEHAEASRRIEELQSSLTALTARAASLEAENATLASELQASRDAHSRLEEERSTWIRRAEALEAEASGLIQQAEAEGAALRKKVEQFRAEVAAAQEKLSAVEAEQRQMSLDLRRAGEDNAGDAGLREAVARLREDMEAARAGRAAAEIAEAEWRRKHGNLVLALDDLREELNAAQSRVLAAEASARDWRDRYAAIEASQAGPPDGGTGASDRLLSLRRRLDSLVLRTQREGFGDIERIEGIGPVFGQKLRSVGILQVKDLLEHGASPAGRDRIATEAGIKRDLIAKWTRMADLLRVDGVEPDWAELLEEAGVRSVSDLRGEVPADLHARLSATNATGRYARSVPPSDTVRMWVERASTLEPRIIPDSGI